VWAKLVTSGKGFLLTGDVLDWFFEHDYAAAHAGAPAGKLRSAALASLWEPRLSSSPELMRSTIGLVSAADWLQ
jgi:hypothetical protein